MTLLPVCEKTVVKRYHFRSKWQQREIENVAQTVPADELKETLIKMKEAQLHWIIMKKSYKEPIQ